MGKRVTKAMLLDELKVGKVLGKRPTSSRDFFVLLGSKKDAEILKQAVKEAEKWKETMQCTVPRLRTLGS